MRPLQVYVDESELARLDAWSRRHCMTKSQAVRAALRAITRTENEDSLLRLSGSIQGLPADMSADFDQYLQETFVAHPSHVRHPAKTRIRR